MTHQHKTIPPKRTPRTRRRRFGRPERSLAAAACLSALVVLGVALAISLTKLAIPTSALHNFFELAFVNGQVSPQSPLYQDWWAQNTREDILFTSPFSLFCGGLALPFLAPRSAGRARVLRAAVAVPAVVSLGYLLLFWGSVLGAVGGHLQPGVVDTQLVLTQAGVSLTDIAVFVLGAFLGLLRRGARPKIDADGPPPAEARAATR